MKRQRAMRFNGAYLRWKLIPLWQRILFCVSMAGVAVFGVLAPAVPNAVSLTGLFVSLVLIVVVGSKKTYYRVSYMDGIALRKK